MSQSTRGDPANRRGRDGRRSNRRGHGGGDGGGGQGEQRLHALTLEAMEQVHVNQEKEEVNADRNEQRMANDVVENMRELTDSIDALGNKNKIKYID
jgi:hypothetical protein